MQPDLNPITPAAIDWRNDAPHAPAFDDCYFSRDNGVEESRLVFLHGNRLAERFARLKSGDQFVVGEVGFGTGLNALLTAALFESCAPPGARLHFVSAEKHPLKPADLSRALAAWPDLAHLSRALAAYWPAPVCGVHRLWLTERIDLTLMFGDAATMWSLQETPVDAWLLDGFAPARNPDCWSPELFACLADRSRPGATIATFSAASSVRQTLVEAGFRVERVAGHARKRHRLEGKVPGTWQPAPMTRGHALVIGAGLAGATTARALAERGWQVSVVDAEGVAAGASGNRAGVVYTTPSGMATPQNRFYQSSYLHALRWLRRFDAESHGIARLNGVVQHATDARHRHKLEQAARSGHWPPDLMTLADARIELHGAGTIRPPEWCRLLLSHPRITLQIGEVRELLEPAGVRLESGKIVSADVVVLCVAGQVNALIGEPALPIRRIRGQVTECRATPASLAWTQAHCHEGYLVPAIDGIHCVGATFDLHESTPNPREHDDQANLATLRERLPQQWQDLGGPQIAVTGQRVGFRCQANDYLPVVGPLPARPDVWINTAHGSRGISGTPLAAERIADALSGAPAALDRNIRLALDPARFDRRARRGGKRRRSTKTKR